ncbi:MAG: protoheme IX farnesyltransferase, partial [Actinomycetota bacterium]|nr:protoheme IX farnesyltransferase [Actinomycetota bacterium]
MATTIAARRGIGETVRAHVALTKPRIIELLLVTALPTLFLAAQGLPTVRATIGVLAGGALAAGAA